MATTPVDLSIYREDPVAFIRLLRNPEDGKPFELFEEQELFLREAFRRGADGRLLCEEAVFSAIKKSGKTTLASLTCLYASLALGIRHPEVLVVSNDLQQAQERVFTGCVRIAEASFPKKYYRVTKDRITFPQNGATITAIASDYRGAAGANQSLVVFDELWGYSTEDASRLLDELPPSPARQISLRLVVTYAGFTGQSDLLEGIYARGLSGEEIAPDLFRTSDGMLFYHLTRPVAPWQTEKWIEQQRARLRPSAYQRQILNQFASSEESYIDPAWFDAVATSERVYRDPSLQVVLGIDAGLKRDSAAVVAVSWDERSGKARIVNHRIFTPVPGHPLDIESTLEAAVLDFARRYSVLQARYDPWQFARSAQTLQKQGVPMLEYPMSIPNLTSISLNLYELLKSGAVIAYPDPEIRSAIQQAIVVETGRGLRLSKERASHKIDVLVACAIACRGAVEVLADQGFDFGGTIVAVARTGMDGIKQVADVVRGALASDEEDAQQLAPVDPEAIIEHPGLYDGNGRSAAVGRPASRHPSNRTCGVCARAAKDAAVSGGVSYPAVATASLVTRAVGRLGVKFLGEDDAAQRAMNDPGVMCGGCQQPLSMGHLPHCPEFHLLSPGEATCLHCRARVGHESDCPVLTDRLNVADPGAW